MTNPMADLKTTTELEAELERELNDAVRLETIENLVTGALDPTDEVAVAYLRMTRERIAEGLVRRDALRRVLALREQAQRQATRVAKAREVLEKVADLASGCSGEVVVAVAGVLQVEVEHFDRLAIELAEAEEALL